MYRCKSCELELGDYGYELDNDLYCETCAREEAIERLFQDKKFLSRVVEEVLLG